MYFQLCWRSPVSFSSLPRHDMQTHGLATCRGDAQSHGVEALKQGISSRDAFMQRIRPPGDRTIRRLTMATAYSGVHGVQDTKTITFLARASLVSCPRIFPIDTCIFVLCLQDKKRFLETDTEDREMDNMASLNYQENLALPGLYK